MFKEVFEKSKAFIKKHPQVITVIGAAVVAQGIDRITKDRERVEKGIVQCATKSDQRVFEYGDYVYEKEEDYDKDIIRRNNPTRTKMIADKYIDWLPQSTMDTIIDSFVESKQQYLE